MKIEKGFIFLILGLFISETHQASLTTATTDVSTSTTQNTLTSDSDIT
jgi:hypothetical protein